MEPRIPGSKSGRMAALIVVAAICIAGCPMSPIPGDLFRITYDANGADAGDVPVDDESYEAGSSVVLAEPESLSRETFEFDGWNTEPDGSGDAHVPGSSFTMPAENVVLYAQWTLRTVTLRGTIMFNGRPYAASVPSIHRTVKNVAADEWLYDASLPFTYDEGTGEYQLDGVPDGEILLWLGLLHTPPDWQLGGNFIIESERYYIDQLTDAERNDLDLEVSAVVHLTEPYDNGVADGPIVGTYTDYRTYDSPVSLTWDAVPDATSYQLTIARYRTPDNDGGFGMIESVVNVSVPGTSYAAALDPSEDYEMYTLTIVPYKGSTPLGYYMHKYGNGYGWDFRFRVAP